MHQNFRKKVFDVLEKKNIFLSNKYILINNELTFLPFQEGDVNSRPATRLIRIYRLG
jgi:hypothetical protein